jgi:aldose 1-epimerase
MALTGRQFTITSGPDEASIVEVGAGLRRYTRGGVDVTCSYTEDVLPPKCCGVTLVPWPNRIRGGRYTFDGVERQLALTEPVAGNAIHGLGRWARWDVVRQETSEVTLGLAIVPQNGWPFEVSVEITYALGAEGLTVSARASNTGVTRAPFGAGFHPYLSTHGAPLDQTSVTIPAATRVIVDERQISIGESAVDGTPHDLRAGRELGALRMDDGFTDLHRENGRGIAEVRSPGGGARVWFDDMFGYLQVYTPDELADGRPGVAIEPMTCAADAFNSGAGLIVLEPGAGWTGNWGITPL